MKTLIPKEIRLIIRVSLTWIKDFGRGYWFRFARKRNLAINYTEKVQLIQKLNPNKAKVHNLKISIKAIESIHILPKEIFSFWRIVGKPTKNNGFKDSRSIMGNKITKTAGGGLCQLSGLIYYLSLLSNLEILERYNHSIDIYNEQTRFTPLGSDATVVYGYKDLKISNNTDHPIQFTFLMNEDELRIELNHFGQVQNQKVAFIQKMTTAFEIEVDTMINNQVVNKSLYKRLNTPMF